MNDFFISKNAINIFSYFKKQKHISFFEKNIFLTSGATQGFFSTKTAPHTKFVLELADNENISIINLMWSSQTKKTTTAMGIIFKNMVESYDNAFIMFPKANALPKLIKHKVEPALKGCLPLRGLVEKYREDEGKRKNTFHYETPKNILSIFSPADTKSVTARWMMFDEIAEMHVSVISEAEERAKTYKDIGYKSIRVSTQVSEDDAINYSFNASEAKFMYMMRCPKCNHLFYPAPHHLKTISIDEYRNGREVDKFELLSKYVPFASKHAYLECEQCGYKIYDSERVRIIDNNECEWVEVNVVQKKDSNFVFEIAEQKTPYFESVGLAVNTMCMSDVPMKEFIRKEIEAFVAEPDDREHLYEKYYAGDWNILYKSQTKEEYKAKDILKISNGLNRGEVRDDTNAIHIQVDLQHNRLYIVVAGVRYGNGMVMDIIDYEEVYNESIGADWFYLEELLDKRWVKKNGDEMTFRSCGIDIKGFSQTEATRSYEAMRFIAKYQEKLNSFGVLETDSIIYATVGLDKVPDAGSSYIEKKKKVETEDGGRAEIKVIHFSNFKIKSMYFNMLNRAIKKANGEDIKDVSLLYINNDIVEEAMTAENINSRNIFINHMISEHLAKEVKEGKVSKEERYIKKYSGIRNDYLDCIVGCILQSLYHVTYRSQKKELVELSPKQIDEILNGILPAGESKRML